MRAGRAAVCLLGLVGWLAACAAASPEPDLPAVAADAPSAASSTTPQPLPPSPPLPWPGGESCRERLAAVSALPEAARQRLSPESPAFAVWLVDRDPDAATASRRPAMVHDLPAPVIEDGRKDAARCLVVVERARTARAASRRVVGHAIVRSTYRRGTQHTANPEHAALRRRLREIDGSDGIGVMATGDPGLDLIGIIAGSILGGFDAVGRAREEQELEAALAATPRTFEEPVWEPYTYEVTSVEAARRGWLRAALVDRRQNRGWTIAAERRETRLFEVASGRHAKDRDLLEGHGGLTVLPADLTVWEQAGLQLPLSEIVAMLAEAARNSEGVPADAAAIVAGWPVLPAPSTAAVGPEENAGGQHAGGGPSADGAGDQGFLARPSLVEQVVTADGTRRYRLVRPDMVEPGPLTADP